MDTLEKNSALISTEAQRVVAAQRGDRAAFGELVSRYERSVFAVAIRRRGNEAEAQELVQEVFVQALKRLYQLRDPERFGRWLSVITQRMAINRITRRKPDMLTRRTPRDEDRAERVTPLAEALMRERRQQVRAGLKRLRELDRRTLVSFYMEGHSLVEMSHEFDSPIGTIKRRLHVARKRLARELGEEMAAV